MRDPDLVKRAERAAVSLERAWIHWRGMHGLNAEPMPPVSSYVGYSLEEPWGQPRVVFGVAAEEAEKLAALLDGHDCVGPVHAELAARPDWRHLADSQAFGAAASPHGVDVLEPLPPLPDSYPAPAVQDAPPRQGTPVAQNGSAAQNAPVAKNAPAAQDAPVRPDEPARPDAPASQTAPAAKSRLSGKDRVLGKGRANGKERVASKQAVPGQRTEPTVKGGAPAAAGAVPAPAPAADDSGLPGGAQPARAPSQPDSQTAAGTAAGEPSAEITDGQPATRPAPPRKFPAVPLSPAAGPGHAAAEVQQPEADQPGIVAFRRRPGAEDGPADPDRGAQAAPDPAPAGERKDVPRPGPGYRGPRYEGSPPRYQPEPEQPPVTATASQAQDGGSGERPAGQDDLSQPA